MIVGMELQDRVETLDVLQRDQAALDDQALS